MQFHGQIAQMIERTNNPVHVRNRHLQDFRDARWSRLKLSDRNQDGYGVPVFDRETGLDAYRRIISVIGRRIRGWFAAVAHFPLNRCAAPFVLQEKF